MSIDSYKSTGQMFINLCQASIVGAVVTVPMGEEFIGIPIFMHLAFLAGITYLSGIHLINRASELRRKEEKQNRRR